MSATQLGTTGVWGVTADETGFLITDFQLDYSQQEKPVLDKSGDVIGLGAFGEMVDIKIGGLVPSTSAFSGKLAAVLTVTNTIADHLQGGVTGETITSAVSRSMNNEDFEQIEVSAKHYPEMSIA